MALVVEATSAIGDLSVLAGSWRRALRAQNKSPRRRRGRETVRPCSHPGAPSRWAASVLLA